eukprot:COSAG05_NODE_965_length_6403_cov_50.682741_9_plen_166_part_00
MGEKTIRFLIGIFILQKIPQRFWLSSAIAGQPDVAAAFGSEVGSRKSEVGSVDQQIGMLCSYSSTVCQRQRIRPANAPSHGPVLVMGGVVGVHATAETPPRTRSRTRWHCADRYCTTMVCVRYSLCARCLEDDPFNPEGIPLRTVICATYNSARRVACRALSGTF